MLIFKPLYFYLGGCEKDISFVHERIMYINDQFMQVLHVKKQPAIETVVFRWKALPSIKRGFFVGEIQRIPLCA